MSHSTLSEYCHPTGQSTNSNGLDKPVHYTRSKSIAKT